MRQLHQIAALLVAVSFVSATNSRGLAATDPRSASNVIQALDGLDEWLGEGENGTKWRTFLRTAELREQLDLGLEADPAIVSRALQQYNSQAKGLDKRRFVTTRKSLEAWLEALRSQYSDDLAKLAWAARGDHQPIDDERFSQIRSRLSAAARRLEQRLGGDSQFATSWKQYLRWHLLKPHLDGDVKITGQALRDLDRVLRRLRANKPGLEHPVFADTATALEQYRELALWYALGQRLDTRNRYSSYLVELEKQISRNQEKPTVESTRQIGKIVGLVKQLGDSADLAKRVKDGFDQKNILLDVSSAALQRVAQRPVSETSPVRDCILGARVLGTANSCGVLSVKTKPAADHIAVELQLAGNIQSRTFSYKKPVRVASRGSTNYLATKQLAISDERFLLLPSTASAHTRSKTLQVKKTGGQFAHRLIERIARKKVAESKPQANYIAARHAEEQVAEKFDKQVVEALHEARSNYDAKLRPPLQRIGMFPDNLQMSSTDSSVSLGATLANYKQISTDQLPPGARTDNDFTVRLHESAINNFVPHLVGGARIGQSDPLQPPKLEGDIPQWLKKLSADPKVEEQFAQESQTEEAERADFKPWEFVLNSEHPLSVSFSAGSIALRIRLAELKTVEDGEETILKNWDFLVTYAVEQNGNRIVLRREPKIEVFPTDFDPVWDNKLNARQVGLRQNLQDNINKRVAEGGGLPLEVDLPPIELPVSESSKLELTLQQLECDEGWLTLGYRLP